MRIWKKIVAASLCAALVFTGLSGARLTAKAEEQTVSVSQSYVDAMNPGWNLGNTFDGFDTGGDRGEESWGNPKVTKELIHTIKEQGFNSIRMPFTSVMRTGEAPEYKLDETFLARYAEVVNWALDEGLYVMINLHHDSWNWAAAIGADWDGGASLARYKAIWTQLSDYFKDYPEKVSFESLNEPQFWSGDEARQLEINDEVNQAFYDIVRNSGGKNSTRMLVLPTLNTNDSQSRCDALYKMINGLKDENIIATFHYYGYWPFSTNIAGTTTMDATVVNELEAAFERVYNTFTKNGIGVICGEYGLLGFDKSLNAIEHGEVLKYFDYINYYSRKTNIPLMLWDNGQHMNRTKYVWGDQSLYDTIKASWTGRSSYTETDRVFLTEDSLNKNVFLNLTLNGNKLKEIYYGDELLTNAKDYASTPNKLILKSKFVQSLVTGEYGEVAKLRLVFSDGADWILYVNYCKAPVVLAGSGDKSGYVIPIEFNGNVLSTLEAVKEDGSGVGPQNWTSYKEYDYAFSVDYKAGTVTFTEKFFKEAEDSTVLVTFHFQNGSTEKTKFTIAGDKVTFAKESDVEGSDEKTEVTKPVKENAEKEKPAKEETYVVEKGDSLWKIAKKLLGKGSEWTTLYTWNKDSIKNQDFIQIGQKLVIKK